MSYNNIQELIDELMECDPEAPVAIGVEVRDDRLNKFIRLDWHHISVIQEGDIELNGHTTVGIYAGEKI